MMRKNFSYTVNVDAWDSYGKVGHAVLYLDPENSSIAVEILRGPDVEAVDLMTFLLADKDVRQLILCYQQSERKLKYSIRCSSHMSGAMDYYINFYSPRGAEMRGKKLVHISCFGKLNEGFPEMYIGDFVELVAEMQRDGTFPMSDLSNPKKVRRCTTCRYEKGYFDDGMASTSVSKVLNLNKKPEEVEGVDIFDFFFNW